MKTHCLTYSSLLWQSPFKCSVIYITFYFTWQRVSYISQLQLLCLSLIMNVMNIVIFITLKFSLYWDTNSYNLCKSITQHVNCFQPSNCQVLRNLLHLFHTYVWIRVCSMEPIYIHTVSRGKACDFFQLHTLAFLGRFFKVAPLEIERGRWKCGSGKCRSGKQEWKMQR